MQHYTIVIKQSNSNNEHDKIETLEIYGRSNSCVHSNLNNDDEVNNRTSTVLVNIVNQMLQRMSQCPNTISSSIPARILCCDVSVYI